MAKIRLAAGETYNAKRVRSGNGERGNWEMIVVSQDKNDMTVFATNIPSGVVEGGNFRVKTIESISKGYRKKQDGTWELNISVEAEVEPMQSEFTEDVSGDFNFDDLPF